MKVFYLLIVLTFLFYYSHADDNLSYSQLSLKYTYNAFNNINLDNINTNIIPGDLYKIRKQLLLTRTYMDIFTYTYHLENLDRFEILRGDLNKGYTYIGEFDDLKHVNYTNEDKDKYLSKCLNWKKIYLIDVINYNFKLYLNNVSKNMIIRNKDKLSIDFWGNISAIPNNSLTGYQNIGILAKGQLINCYNAYEYLLTLENIWKNEYHTVFHNYRKLIRSINFIADFFPEIYSQNVKSYKKNLEKAYSSLGKINDVINEYSYYKKNGYSKMSEEKQNEIIVKWKDLRNWFIEVGLNNVLQNMSKFII